MSNIRYKPFYPSLIAALNRRIVLSADDGKAAAHPAASILETRKKDKLHKQRHEALKLLSQKSARTPANRPITPIEITIENLKVVSTLCASNRGTKTSTFSNYEADGCTNFVDNFIPSLMKLASGLSRELVSAASARLRVATKV